MAEINILAECDGLPREQQEAVLRVRAPELRIWSATTTERLPCALLIVATWSQLDNAALADYLSMSGSRAIALHAWFQTKDELKRAAGYDGPCLQSPILVIRSQNGSVDWSGEGFQAKQELKRRASLA